MNLQASEEYAFTVGRSTRYFLKENASFVISGSIAALARVGGLDVGTVSMSLGFSSLSLRSVDDSNCPSGKLRNDNDFLILTVFSSSLANLC